MSKGAVIMGGSVVGGVTTYYIVDVIKGSDSPTTCHAIIPFASQQQSELLVNVNLGGGLSTVVIIFVLLVSLLCKYKCGIRCGRKCCGE